MTGDATLLLINENGDKGEIIICNLKHIYLE